MDEKEYKIWEDSMFKSSSEVLSFFLDSTPELCDECDFYPGQRFAIECISPCRSLLVLELEYSLKQKIVQKVFQKEWKMVPSPQRDDCFLEILNMILRNHIKNLFGVKDVHFRCGLPRVIYDEYEDDLEVRSLDFYKFDFQMKEGAYSLIRGILPK